MYLTSIDQINHKNNIIILYPSGASGEFLAGSIAKTFHGVHSSQLNEYVTENRYTYFDLFDRVLNSSMGSLTHEQVLAGVNNYFSTNYCDSMHVGLAHSTLNTLSFINQHLHNARIIEITTCDSLSKNFRYLAAELKIPKHQKFTESERMSFFNDAMIYTKSGILSHNKLAIEWIEVFSNPHNVVHELQEFLGLECDRDSFIGCIQEYIQRNAKLMERCGVVPAPLS